MIVKVFSHAFAIVVLTAIALIPIWLIVTLLRAIL